MIYGQIALFGIKHWKEVLIALLMFFGILFSVFVGVFTQSTPDMPSGGGGQAISPLVMRYEPLVSKYAKQYGVEQYVPLLLAKIQQESGGKLPDVMQSSESLGLPPNSITDPEYSIQVGVKYFAGIIKATKFDVKLALQSYNFGGGFIPYANAHGGYSKEVATAFSNMMADKMGWSRYGDINYVDNVLRYYNPTGSAASIPIGGTGGKDFQNVMKVALQYQGMPYQWGGANPITSFDCSGLWQWSFKQIGINLPRTAAEQYKYTARISKNQLQPGDFIFFTGTADHNYISHMGLYVGNGRMYNANSKGVTYSPMKGYWEKHIAGIGRLNGFH